MVLVNAGMPGAPQYCRVRGEPRRRKMGKKTKDELKLMESVAGVMSAIVTILVAAVRKLGGGFSDFRRLTTPEGVKTVEKIAALIVGQFIFERMLEACKFDWVNSNITPENFPIAEEPEGSEFVLVHLNKTASTEEAEAEIKKQGLEPATLADLLLYVRNNPNKQKEFPIVALGSKQDLDGYWNSPYASYWFGERNLVLRWREDDWSRRFRFLARKR